MPSIMSCIPIEIELPGLSNTLHLCRVATYFASSPIKSKQALLYLRNCLIVDFPIESKVMKRSTMGLPLALPGYLEET
jgi:hypothetical protein